MWILFLLLLPNSIDSLKMVKIFGKVDQSTYSTPYEDSLTCFDECYSVSRCYLAYLDSSGECFHYSLSNQSITVSEVDERSYVAFKTDVDSCPASFDDLVITYKSQYASTVAWNRVENGWNFKGCLETWRRFQREDNLVICMRTFSTFESTKQEAIDSCISYKETIGFTTFLTGVASVEEAEWIKQYWTRIVGDPGCSDLDPTGEEYLGVWINGVRNCPDESSCAIFKWEDGYTNTDEALSPSNANLKSMPNGDTETSEGCLTIADMPDHPSKYINDVPCGFASCNRGYVCAYISE
uniref:CW domain-containing protein n=1 Tax=Caenorhabditis tropicalis TaxID=1561998 RepID=A0A1I7TBP2_9PELO